MLGDADGDVEVTRAARGEFSRAADGSHRAILDAGRDVHGQLGVAHGRAAAVTLRAG